MTGEQIEYHPPTEEEKEAARAKVRKRLKKVDPDALGSMLARCAGSSTESIRLRAVETYIRLNKL